MLVALNKMKINNENCKYKLAFNKMNSKKNYFLFFIIILSRSST